MFYVVEQVQENVTTSKAASEINAQFYNSFFLQIYVVSASGTCSLKIQTSNDNVNWVDLHDFGTVTDGSYFKAIPDYTSATKCGFGRYVRLYATVGTSISYNARWLFRK